MKPEKLKLLIVDDEPDICKTFQSFFARRGFSVLVTGSGRQALSMIKTSRPDIVFLDITLNDVNGIEVLKQLRESDQETKVVIITGQLYSHEDIEKIYTFGISGYKIKPLILEEVEKLVYEVIGQKQPPKTNSPVKKINKDGEVKGFGWHKLLNLLGIIRNKCENFTLNFEDGIYKDKSAEELVKMSVGIMKDVEETVDRTMEVVEQIKKK